MDKPVAQLKVLDSNGSYLIEGAVLPFFINDQGEGFVVEDYEGIEPCEHAVSDLLADGVKYTILPI